MGKFQYPLYIIPYPCQNARRKGKPCRRDWLTPAETLEMWSGPAAITVETGHETHEGVFYRERLAEGFDQILVLYSLENFLTDSNIVLMK